MPAVTVETHIADMTEEKGKRDCVSLHMSLDEGGHLCVSVNCLLNS